MNKPFHQQKLHPKGFHGIAVLAFILLFMGFGRISSLVTHSPLLAYANSYDMVRIQACHQIWPADAHIKPGAGTPDAPLLRYTTSHQVQTQCFPSSELLFTWSGIKLASLYNQLSGESTISIRMIGLAKAAFLIATALIASLYFYTQKNAVALLVNGASVLLILSDPAITLYLSTFYTEFSAVYFLYVSLLGIVYLKINQWKKWHSVPFLIGIMGFGFSKPQHMPLLLSMGVFLSTYLLIKKRTVLACVIAALSITPILFSTIGTFTPRHNTMALANKVNAMGSFLQAAKHPEDLLNDMNLPETCLQLSGKTWYHLIYQKRGVCDELDHISHSRLVIALIKRPDVFYRLVTSGLPMLRTWTFNLYGHVENQKMAHIKKYFWSMSEILEKYSEKAFIQFALAPSILFILFCLIQAIKRRKISEAESGFLALIMLSCGVFLIALTGDGFVDLSKHAHLFVPLVGLQYLLLLVFFFNNLRRMVSNLSLS